LLYIKEYEGSRFSIAGRRCFLVMIARIVHYLVSRPGFFIGNSWG
jgi:hypothetical protein